MLGHMEELHFQGDDGPGGDVPVQGTEVSKTWWDARPNEATNWWKEAIQVASISNGECPYRYMSANVCVLYVTVTSFLGSSYFLVNFNRFTSVVP